jgi:hypothetical protein
MAMAVIAVADPVWATIIDIDLTGRYHQYFIDRNGDGFEDGVVRILPSNITAPTFRRYMQLGARVLYENDGSWSCNRSTYKADRESQH